jgi:predicted Zn-dependent protease
MTENGGEFHVVSGREIYGGLHNGERGQFYFVYVLPTSILVWNFLTKNDEVLDPDKRFETIRALANKHRYQGAKTLGNIAMGAWGPEVHEYARHLLREGDTRQGLVVLRDLLATSSFNYQAHVDLIENTSDPAAIIASAEIVIKNAESRKLIDRAAKALERSPAALESIPYLERNETGLQVILIPISPCNPWLLEEAARTYQQITEIPVKVRRLKELWWFAAPDRVYRQRNIQSVLIRLRGETIDFAGWNRERYASELMKAIESEDALSRYRVKELVASMNEFSGQFRVGPVLNWLSARLEDIRSDDNRTMYVGITEANIYSGDSNYIFSRGILKGSSPVSVLSYSVMLAETLQEAYESRPRLIERIAKEMVPASLKQLGISRPLDPSDPYSYANGVTRLDQKTLVLSNPTKDALKTFRSD